MDPLSSKLSLSVCTGSRSGRAVMVLLLTVTATSRCDIKPRFNGQSHN